MERPPCVQTPRIYRGVQYDETLSRILSFDKPDPIVNIALKQHAESTSVNGAIPSFGVDDNTIGLWSTVVRTVEKYDDQFESRPPYILVVPPVSSTLFVFQLISATENGNSLWINLTQFTTFEYLEDPIAATLLSGNSTFLWYCLSPLTAHFSILTIG